MPGPNSLWHIDGHHSLITWGFIIHGCIDGYSCLICFLKCSTNNRKETVEDLFLQSVEKYFWPSRMQTNHEGENVLVWERIRTERNWSPEQIWSNGIIDRVNGRLAAVDDVRSNVNISGHEHEWFGFDPDAPPPPDDGLSTVEVNEVNLDLPDNIISRLSNEINPLENSSAFAIDIFQRALEFLENLLPNHSSQ